MKKTIIIFATLLSGIILLSCTQNSKTKSSVPENMQLVWSDEFDKDGEPDPEKWSYSIGGNGWGNGELQKYTKDRKNSFVKDGKLSIVAQNENGTWTSARLKTQYIASWKYGYIEISAKLPKGIGTWPALWMMPEFDKYGGWPRSGEIDIMEHVGFDQNKIHTTVHSSANNHKKGTQLTHSDVIKGVSNKFHTYAIHWDENFIEWFIDGIPFYKVENTHNGITQWPFDQKFYLIMNLAIGGSWGGQQGVDKKMNKAQMLVDYVRIYQ